MSRDDAPFFRTGQKNCRDCQGGKFVDGGDDFRCALYNIHFMDTDMAARCVCDSFIRETGWDEE